MTSLKDFIKFATEDEKAGLVLATKMREATIAAAKECGFTLDLNEISDDQLKGVAGAGKPCLGCDGRPIWYW